MTIYGLKVMVKSGLEKIFWNSTCPFIVAAAQCIKICLEGLNWPGWLAVYLKGHVEFQNEFFYTTFKRKMVISRLKILVTYFNHSRW